MTSAISAHGRIEGADGQLYFEQEGNNAGPAILFIHGLGGSTNVYQPLVASLQGFNLVRFDFAGHGRSALSQDTSIDSYVRDCDAVIKHLGLKDITVVGHSLGGLISLHLAAKHPELVTRLVLFGPIQALPQAGKDGCKARAEAVRKNGMVACADAVVNHSLAAETLCSKPAVIGFARELLSRQIPEGYAQACLAASVAENPEWSRIRAATTIVSGDEDKSSSPANCESIAASIERAKVVKWEGVGHWHTLESPVEAAEIVREACTA